MSRLQPILDRRLQDVADAKARRPLAALERAIEALPPCRDFRAALTAPGVQVIAEIKRSSPSLGAIRTDADPAAMARAYESAGAACLSILTEPHHFGGAITDLQAARAATDLPCLRKDFTVDPYQLAETRAEGADAVLLIVAALGRETGAYIELAHAYGLTALVEVHDQAELEIAVGAGADLIGVNNRNLTTLEIDLATFETLRPGIPAGTLAVAESGLEGHGDFLRMARAGADAVLVGSALMRSTDPAAALTAMRGAAA